MAEEKYRVRLVDRSAKGLVVAGEVVFDPHVAGEDADGYLLAGSGSAEFLSSRGVKAWWGREALSHSIYRKGAGGAIVRTLRSNEWIHFAHPDPRFVAPIYTHIHDFVLTGTAGRIEKAIAVVANTGGMWWWAKPGIRHRNRFILNRRVDLFGPQENWLAFRRYGLLSPSRCPANYAGGPPGANMCRGTISKMAEYKVVVCMENTSEHLYFTEKFVQAVQAGAIPVYHAHPSVRDGILSGAAWIDPEDHGFDVDRTLDAALAGDLVKYQEKNAAWFRSAKIARTHVGRVWERVGEIMKHRIDNSAKEEVFPLLREIVKFRGRYLF